MVESELV